MPVFVFKYSHSPYWYYNFTLHGRRFRESTGTKVKSDARRIADEAYKKALLGKPQTSSGMLLSQHKIRYEQQLIDKGITKNTRRIYMNALDRFINIIGDLELDSYSRADMEKFKTDRKAMLLKRKNSDKRKASNTVNMDIRSVNTAFNHAVHLELLTSNPFAGVKQYPVPKDRRRIHLVEDEISDLLNYIDSELPGKIFGCFTKLLLFTGCRTMSALSLKPGDIDFKLKRITFVNKPGGTYNVPLSAETMALLESMDLSHDYVFHNQHTNSAYERGWAYKSVKDIFRKVGLPDHFSPHNLRHTFASRLLNKGVHLKTVAELLGQGYESTAEIYSHLETATLEDAVESLRFSSI